MLPHASTVSLPADRHRSMAAMSMRFICIIASITRFALAAWALSRIGNIHPLDQHPRHDLLQARIGPSPSRIARPAPPTRRQEPVRLGLVRGGNRFRRGDLEGDRFVEFAEYGKPLRPTNSRPASLKDHALTVSTSPLLAGGIIEPRARDIRPGEDDLSSFACPAATTPRKSLAQASTPSPSNR